MKVMVIRSPERITECVLLPLQITSFLMLAFSLFSHGYLHDHEEVSTHTSTVKHPQSFLWAITDCTSPTDCKLRLGFSLKLISDKVMKLKLKNWKNGSFSSCQIKL